MLGFLNYFVFQWFFIRLAKCYDIETGNLIKYKIIYRKPLTGWIYK